MSWERRWRSYNFDGKLYIIRQFCRGPYTSFISLTTEGMSNIYSLSTFLGIKENGTAVNMLQLFANVKLTQSLYYRQNQMDIVKQSTKLIQFRSTPNAITELICFFLKISSTSPLCYYSRYYGTIKRILHVDTKGRIP